MAEQAEIKTVPVRDEKAELLYQAQLELKARAARTNLKDFIEYMMPDPDLVGVDPLATLYDCWPHHQLIIDLFTSAMNGTCLRGALSIPPQHGKTTVCGPYGLAFYVANNPEHKVIYGTYNDARAGIVGEKVRSIIESDRFKHVFPDFQLKKGSKAKDLLGFGVDGSIMFIGRNSGASGNPCNLFVIDDPFKDRREAKSPAIREEVWDWYCAVVEARCPMQTPIFIIHTRWSDDDLIGRLCDKDHPNYDPTEQDEFDYLNLPAIITDPDLAAALDMDPTKLPAALWPGTKEKPMWPLEILHRMRKRNSVTFSALYMGDPMPPDGDFFTSEMVREYRAGQLPVNLTWYGSSDHAVSERKSADSTVLGTIGMDSNGHLWVHPDLVWDRIGSEKQVNEMARLIKARRPVEWYAEGDHIKKAILPFLKTVLRKLRLFTTVFKELSKVGDKQQKAQSIRALAAMGMLHLPGDAPWFARAKAQMLRFDGSEGRPDDFVDFLANAGRGLDRMMPAQDDAPPEDEKMPETGTAAWVKMASRQDAAVKRLEKANAGW